MKILIYSILLLIPTLSLGQRAKIAFEKTTFNMGLVQENGGKVTHEFKFTNKGKAPLLIKFIETTCGCTTPKWNRKPIPPGDSGVVTVTFNPKDRPGVFSKKIIVYTNATPPNIVLRLEGEVITKSVDIPTTYPIVVGNLRFTTDTIRLKQAETKHQIINLINTGKKNISILSIFKPNYLEVDCTPLTLGKEMMGNLIIRYLPKHADKIKPDDYEMQVYRSSGAGGQHINKTSSAVRLIHKATGIVVACQTERSQLQNKENCLRMLRSKLVEIKEREHLEKISDIKGVQQKIEWGSQIRSYVFMPYTLAKDTRTGFENANINAVMDGDIDGFINAYLSALATGVWEGSKGGNM